ncbi:DegV family protein, partial [Bacillus sp. WP8]|uniref:DegV family protein n=1 Tax=Bacillus sp. WP8 TaxID=756828 RepID=UPI0037BF66F9
MKRHKHLPTTSHPPFPQLIPLYQKLSQTYHPLITIHLSTAITPTYNTPPSANHLLQPIHIYPFHTQTSSIPQRFYFLQPPQKIQQRPSLEEL